MGDCWLCAGTVSIFRDRPVDIKQIEVHDIRGRESEFTLAKQGFELVKHDFQYNDFEDPDKAKEVFWPTAAEFLRRRLGASKVVPMSAVARQNTYEALEKDAEVKGPDDVDGTRTAGAFGPARWVHVDQSTAGARVILRDIMGDDSERLSKSRWAIINIWKAISDVVRRDPLGMIDRTTLDAADLVPKEISFPEKRKGAAHKVTTDGSVRHETCAVKWNPDHQWYYYSDMTKEEILLLQIFDSRDVKSGTVGTAHSSFAVPGTEMMEVRRSVELRCLGKLICFVACSSFLLTYR